MPTNLFRSTQVIAGQAESLDGLGAAGLDTVMLLLDGQYRHDGLQHTGLLEDAQRQPQTKLPKHRPITNNPKSSRTPHQQQRNSQHVGFRRFRE